jgi:hypothetical protein
MKNSTEAKGVRFHNVVFDTEGIILFDRQSRLLSVPKKDIRHITLKHGFQSERPIAQVLFGVAVMGLGIYFVIDFLLIALVEGVVYDVGCLSPLLLPVGIWFTVDGLRKRLYFEVALDNDKRKFPLGKTPDKGELQMFIKIASQMGYSIDAKILDRNIIN